MKYLRLTRAAVKALPPSGTLTESGITAIKLLNDDVRYSINVMVDGQRIHRSVGRESEGVSRSQAEQVIETLRTRAREGRLSLPKARKTHISFAEAAEKYLEALENAGGKQISRKKQHLESYLKPFFSAKSAKSITEMDVQAYCKKRQNDGAASATVNRELASLSHLFHVASSTSAKWIAKDDVPNIPRLQESTGRITALSEGECERLLDAAKLDQDPDLWLFVMIGLHTSMRHGEIRRLRFDEYDAARRRFFIQRAKAGQREQPITQDLSRVLTLERSKRTDKYGYIFPPGAGSLSGYRHTFRKAFGRAVRTAGMDESIVTPHVMRHTAITRLVKAGVDLPTVQRISGHKTLSMVLRYSHVDGRHIDKGIEALQTSP